MVTNQRKYHFMSPSSWVFQISRMETAKFKEKQIDGDDLDSRFIEEETISFYFSLFLWAFPYKNNFGISSNVGVAPSFQIRSYMNPHLNLNRIQISLIRSKPTSYPIRNVGSKSTSISNPLSDAWRMVPSSSLWSHCKMWWA